MRRMPLVLLVVLFFHAVTFSANCPQGDLTGDCVVSFPDLIEFAGQWLNLDECEGETVCANFDGLNGIDYVDFSILAGNWLQGMPLVINEFMASNNSDSGISDPQGEFDDWIEIYNFGDTPINLAGMYLTDDLTNPTQWQIPAGYSAQTTIAAKSFLVFWADEETQDTPVALHANFKLSAGGEDIGLFAADGTTLIDSLTFAAQSTNIAYGRYPDASDNWRYFPTPTKGAINNGAYIGEIDDTEFSHTRGFYDAAFNLTIACDTPGVSIYYTTNGNAPITGQAPAAGATLYNGAIPISTSTSIRAAAIKTGWLPTNIDTHTFIFGANAAQKAMSAVCLSGSESDTFFLPNGIMAYKTSRGRAYERPASLEIIDLQKGTSLQENCGIRLHGSDDTRPQYTIGDDWATCWVNYWPGNNSNKIGFNVWFRSDYGNNRFEYPFFPNSEIDRYKSIVLRQGKNDACTPFMKDEWGRRLFREMGRTQVTGTFANLYLNGEYKSYYNPSERADGEFYKEWYGTDNEFDVITQSGIRDGDATAWNSLLSYANSHDLSNTAYYNYVASKFDIPTFVDFLIIEIYGGNFDWPNNNWDIHRERSANGILRFSIWDIEGLAEAWYFQSGCTKCADTAFDKFPSYDAQGLNNGSWPICQLYRALRVNPDFKQLFADQVHKHFRNGGVLTKTHLLETWAEVFSELSAVLPETQNYPVRFVPDTFIPVREEYVLAAFNTYGLFNTSLEAPSYNVNGTYQHGGYISSSSSLTMTNPSGTGAIYYTTDGSDPRAGTGSSTTTVLVAESAAKKVRVPTSDIGTTWRGGSEPYTETGWTSGSGGVGYERATSNDYDSFIGLDVESIMYNVNSTCYIRIPFNVNSTQLPNYNSLTLKVRYDDGFVAYINGTEVTRGNFTGTPAWNSSTGNIADNTALITFNISSYLYTLHSGTNILAIQGLNTGSTSSDFLISATLEAGTAQLNLSPSAIQYSGAFTLSKSTNLRSRIYNSSGNAWSALNEAVYEIGSVKDKLRITELMYHPSDPNTEYVELRNISSDSIHLNLVKFTKGINYTFGNVTLTAGQHILIVENLAEFQAKYGTSLNVAGQYTGSLNNAGERVRLEDAIGNAILDFEYKDGWRSIADGDGYSLTITNPVNTDTSSWGYKDSWRASAYVGGSPGTDDSGIIPNPGAIVINEVLAHSHSAASDWIELYNTTSSSIDISGWYLSDSDTNLMKYRFADNTIIAANSYLVVTEMANFGSSATDLGRLVPFALSENGDEVYLTSALDTNSVLTGYRAKEDFGASETGVSFGRYYKASTGTYNFVLMESNTLGAVNSSPKVGPIVISEIMYNPDWPAGGSYVNNEYEYVELHNPGTTAVTLYDSEVSLPWKFTGGIEYTFPTTPVTIPAGGKIVVVKNLAAFSWRYPGVSSSIIYGPYSGKLANEGEQLELSKPGDVDELGVRQYIRVERVNFSDGTHPGSDPVEPDLWPTAADGSGSSLDRISPTLYGNDPANWQAITPAPGI